LVLAPYRIAATPEPSGPTEADAYEARLRARVARSRRVLVGGFGVLVALSVVALVESPPRPRDRALVDSRAAARLANAHDTVSAARDFVAREQARFATALEAAFDAEVGPDSAHASCSVKLPDTRLSQGGRAFPLLVVSKGDREIPSPSLASMTADANRADEHFAAGRTMDALVYTNALAARMTNPSARPEHDVVLVTKSMKHPLRTTPTSFEPGEIEGRAYLYDFAKRRVVCAGDVHAVSSRQIEYSYVSATSSAAMDEGPRLSASLDDDLDIQLQRAIATSLVDLERR
jgi:hypothetical protein